MDHVTFQVPSCCDSFKKSQYVPHGHQGNVTRVEKPISAVLYGQTSCYANSKQWSIDVKTPFASSEMPMLYGFIPPDKQLQTKYICYVWTHWLNGTSRNSTENLPKTTRRPWKRRRAGCFSCEEGKRKRSLKMEAMSASLGLPG